jgi:predicted transcriptional regulator
MAAGGGGGDGDGSGGDDWDDDDDDEFDYAPDIDTDMEDDVGESTKSKQAHDSVKKQLTAFQQYNAVHKHLLITIHVLKPLMSVVKTFHVNTRSEAMTIAQYIRDKKEGREVASEVCNMHDSSSCQQSTTNYNFNHHVSRNSEHIPWLISTELKRH